MPSAPQPAAEPGPLYDDYIDEAAAHRDLVAGWVAEEAPLLAELCHRLAERFATGGRLLAFGASPAARSDVRHVAVEFVHPVIVGKRAIAALGFTIDGGPFATQLGLVAEPNDVVLAFEADDGRSDTAEAIALTRDRGCLTLAFGRAAAQWVIEPPARDPFIRQELVETVYHLLWELVHVFLDHRGLLGAGAPGGARRQPAPTGASGFLYPFLDDRERDLEAVMADVGASIALKGTEVAALRRDTLSGSGRELAAAATAIREAFAGGGRLLVLGNGGSATDAMDAAADLRCPPKGWPPRPVIDLTEDTAILSALANDVGAEVMFTRQVIAHGRPGDVALAFSTSGGSRNVLDALAEARRRGLVTVAFAGYDGGRIATERMADHVIIVRSDHIPRIQEAQGTAWHVLRALIELAPPAAGR